jgi:hypothetical protein
MAGASVGDAITKTISSRIAGGWNKEPARVRSRSFHIVSSCVAKMYCLGDGRYL